MRILLKPLLAACLLSLLCACANDHAREAVIANAQRAGMARVEIVVDGFALTGYQRISDPAKNIRVYIEGDGYAWITPDQPADDPTPLRATGLALAALDNAPNVVYLARPCQYSMQRSPQCSVAYWTDKRFSAEVVDAMDKALDAVMRSVPGQQAELVGYSGGAAIAVLLAARRSDIASLRTVAGNLDNEAVNRYHHVSSMPASLNPADVADKIQNLPQRHFYGGQDQVIPVFVAQDFVQRQHGGCVRLTEVAQATHQDGWEAHWAELLRLPLECSK